MNYEEKLGVIYMIFAYILWGFMPVYWKLIQEVPSGEILAHRIIWSFILMGILILLTRNWKKFVLEWKKIVKDRGQLIRITFASLLISLNWLTYIWAVNSNHVVQASLGYYINPLISILLGMIVLKEKSSKGQILSFILAGIGVIYLTVSYGVFPWVSLILAFTFAFYGLLKKTVSISSMFGLTIETLIVTPIALLYLFSLPAQSFTFANPTSIVNLLLIGSGVATAIPLLLFGSGSKFIPLSMVGILQFIAPTIMLFLGVFLYNESFTNAHLIAFIFIWAALIVYMFSHYKRPVKV